MSHRIEWADCGCMALTDGEMSRVVGGESWGYESGPAFTSLTYAVASLPLKGVASSVPIAGNYWPA